MLAPEITGEALDALEKAIHAGWLDASWLERDSELRPLLGVARFSVVLQEIGRFPKIDWQRLPCVS